MKARQARADGASLGAVDTQRGFHALLWAAEMGRLEMAKYLIDEGIAVDEPSAVKGKFCGMTALMRACSNGHVSLLNMLLVRGADATLVNAAGGNPLGAAAAFGDKDAVLALLAHGVDVNSPSRTRNNTALSYAASRGNAAVVMVLCDRSADVNLPNNEGESPLMRAAAKGHTPVVTALCDHSADINLQQMGGKTALMLAFRAPHDSEQIVAELLSRGADLQLMDESGCQAIHYSIYRDGCPDCIPV